MDWRKRPGRRRVRHELVDSARIGTVGYCFGGTAVIEMIEQGAPISGAVTIHGSFRGFTRGVELNVLRLGESCRARRAAVHAGGHHAKEELAVERTVAILNGGPTHGFVDVRHDSMMRQNL